MESAYFNSLLTDYTPLELALAYEEADDHSISPILQEMQDRMLTCNDLEQLLHDYRHDSPSSLEL